MIEKVFIRIDVDRVGDSIELALLKLDYEKAQAIHDGVQNSIDKILEKIKLNKCASVLMKGCDDILFSFSKNDFESSFLKNLKNDFEKDSDFTLSVGIGASLGEALLNLRIAKVSGKNKIVGENICKEH